MKRLFSSIETLFSEVSQDGDSIAYWETLNQTEIAEMGAPITSHTIRVTALLPHTTNPVIGEVSLRCGQHLGKPYEDIDRHQKEKIQSFKASQQSKIQALARRHKIELRQGILTDNPKEVLFGVVNE